MGRSLRSGTPPEAIDQSGERHEVDDAKARASTTENHLDVGRGEVCPLRGNGADDLLVDLQQESHAEAVVPSTDTKQRSLVEGMERVRDADKTHQRDGTVCTLE